MWRHSLWPLLSLAVVLSILSPAPEAVHSQPAKHRLPAYDPWRVVAGDRPGPEDFVAPSGLAVDERGNLYVVDSHHRRVVKFGPEGQPLAVYGTLGSGDGHFMEPNGVAVDAGGTIYVTDPPTGRILRIAADGHFLDSWGGPASPFKAPRGLSLDSDGNLWVADPGATQIVKLSTDGAVLTHFGGGQDALATIGMPVAVVTAKDGTVYAADSSRGAVVQFSADGDILARWNGPSDEPTRTFTASALLLDDEDSLFVGETYDVLKLSLSGEVVQRWSRLPLLTLSQVNGLAPGPDSTVYVSDSEGFVALLDAQGQPVRVLGAKPPPPGQLRRPAAVAVDERGNMFVADTENHRIQRIDADGTIDANWGRQNAPPSRFWNPIQITLDNADHLLVADSVAGQVTEFDPYGRVVRVLGGGVSRAEAARIPGKFVLPTGVAADSAGNVYIADAESSRLQRIGRDGLVQQLNTAGDAATAQTRMVAAAADGTLVVATGYDGLAGLRRLTANGAPVPRWPGPQTIGSTPFNLVGGLALDAAGNVWVTDVSGGRIVAVAPDGSLLGVWGESGSGVGQFNAPSGIWVDESGTVYVADSANDRVQAMSPVVAQDVLGDPVLTNTGEYTYTHTDARIVTSSGATITFTRTYGSLRPGGEAFGHSWAHNFEVSLTHENAAGPNDLRVNTPTGFIAFSATDTGEFVPEIEGLNRLVQNSDGTYTAITLSGEAMVSHFNRGGQLIGVSDIRGHELTLGYDRNRLVSIGDAAEPDALTLTYDTCVKGRLCSITDHADPPRVIRYDYDEHGLLSMVTDREGHQTRYGYVPLSFGRLDSIEDAIGHVAIKLDYDGQQRVTTEHFASGRSSQFTYEAVSPSVSRTSYTSAPAGYAPDWTPITIDTYSSRAIRSREWRTGAQDSPLVQTYTYNTDGLRTCSWSGGATPAPPNFVEAVPDPEDEGGGVEAPSLRLTPTCATAPTVAWTDPSRSVVDARIPGRETQLRMSAAARQGADMVRDPVGRPVSFTDSSAPEPHYWGIRYDNEDRIRFIEESVASPGASPSTTEFVYDPVGNLIRVVEPSGGVADFTYDAQDSLIAVRSTSGLIGNWTRDDAGNLSRLVLTDVDDSVLFAGDYQFDGLNRPRRLTRYPNWPNTTNAAVVEYVWDDQGRAHLFVPAGP